MTTNAWINLSLPSNDGLVAELEEFQKNMFKQNTTNTIEISNPPNKYIRIYQVA